jgi:ADP-heptose:LPS heptosyltransferase
MTPLRRNILVFHQGALGDFVLTWPIALALARIYPQSRLFYVTHAQKGKLAEKVLRVDSADADAGWHSLFGAGGGQLPETPRKLLAGAHSVLSFTGGGESRFVDNVRAVTPEANVLEVNPNPPDDFAGHVTEFQLSQLNAWPAAHAAAEQILRSIQSRGVGMSRPGYPSDVVIHPGSGSPKKNWPIERYLELIDRLRSRGDNVRVLIGEVETERWPADVVTKLEASRPESYLGLMAELLSARAYVGNDSGPSHLAAILGVPTVALFGPASDPVKWNPIGPKVTTLRAEPIGSLEVERVLSALN